MDGPVQEQQPDGCASCAGCRARDVIIAARDATIAARDLVIADQARVNERVTSELRWHGLDDAALTVAEAFKLYEAVRQGEKCWVNYKSWLAPLVRRYGDLPCLQVTAEKWTEHRALRTKEKCGRWETKIGPTSAVLDQELRLARMMFKWLVQTDKLPRNPLQFAKCANEPSGRETLLPEPDVQRLINGADVLGDDTPAGKRRVLLFRGWAQAKFRGGLRFEEVRQVRSDKIGADGVLELSAKRTKSKKRRTIAFPAIALKAMAAIPQIDGDPRVFVHRPDRGSRVGQLVLVATTTLRGWFHRVAKHTGVDKLAAEDERVVPHNLRHAAASYAEEQGAHPVDIQEFLGHASLATTERYLHRRPAQRAIRMAKIMGGKRAKQ